MQYQLSVPGYAGSLNFAFAIRKEKDGELISLATRTISLPQGNGELSDDDWANIKEDPTIVDLKKEGYLKVLEDAKPKTQPKPDPK